MPVDERDPLEAGLRERDADVPQHRDERREPDVDDPARAAVIGREPERHRRPDERVELLGGALAHLERDVDVRPERPVVAVILGRADRDEHRAAAALQVLAHLEVRHLGHVALHRRPSASRCSREPRIAAVTSASGGHGSPLNSISTEYGPS